MLFDVSVHMKRCLIVKHGTTMVGSHQALQVEEAGQPLQINRSIESTCSLAMHSVVRYRGRAESLHCKANISKVHEKCSKEQGWK